MTKDVGNQGSGFVHGSVMIGMFVVVGEYASTAESRRDEKHGCQLPQPCHLPPACRPGVNAREQVAKNPDGSEARREHAVDLDYIAKAGERIKGDWHTHPDLPGNDYFSAIRDRDEEKGTYEGDIWNMVNVVDAAANDQKNYVPEGELRFYVIIGKTIIVAQVTDPAAARKCAKAGGAAMKKKFDKCITDCYKKFNYSPPTCRPADGGLTETEKACYHTCAKKLGKECGITIKEGERP